MRFIHSFRFSLTYVLSSASRIKKTYSSGSYDLTHLGNWTSFTILLFWVFPKFSLFLIYFNLHVFQEFRKVEKLRDHFPVVNNFTNAGFPTLLNIFEQSVSDIEFILLQIEMSLCERVDSHQVVSCRAYSNFYFTYCAIVFSVKILPIPRIFQIFVFVFLVL